jgi:hypothetical protein
MACACPRVAAAEQHAAGELVDDEHLPSRTIVLSRWNSSLALTALLRQLTSGELAAS